MKYKKHRSRWIFKRNYERKCKIMEITNEDILKYDNVPVNMAAQYLGTSQQYIRIGLQRARLPFGTCVQLSGKENGKWTYHISPGLLVSYKTGKDVLKPLFDNLKSVVQAIIDE